MRARVVFPRVPAVESSDALHLLSVVFVHTASSYLCPLGLAQDLVCVEFVFE